MDKYVKLLASLAIDALGFVAIGLTEFGDLIWAPVSALAIAFLYHKDFYTFLGFAEEILPGADVVPTATIAWLDENGFLNIFHKKQNSHRREGPLHGRSRTITLAD